MKHAHHLSAPNTLQPGHYLFWQHCTYQVVALDPDNALLLHVQPFPEGPGTELSLLDLLAIPRTSPAAPLFAPTLKALHQQIEEQYGNALGATTHDLPNSFVLKARIITNVVEMVRRLVSEGEQRAKGRGEGISRKQAICRALLAVNKTTIRIRACELLLNERLLKRDKIGLSRPFLSHGEVSHVLYRTSMCPSVTHARPTGAIAR